MIKRENLGELFNILLSANPLDFHVQINREVRLNMVEGSIISVF